MNQHEKDYIHYIAFGSLLIPLILFFMNGMIWKESISAYAHLNVGNQYLGIMLSFVSGLFIKDYIQNRGTRYYNLISGISLLGVAWFDMYSFQILHYIFAIIFFATTIITMVTRAEKGLPRKIRFIVAALVTICLSLGVATPVLSILQAEWIGMMPMAMLLAGESNNKSYLEQFIRFLQKKRLPLKK